MILLDTDICVALLRGNRSVLERRRQTGEPVGVAAMTVGELFYGAAKSAQPAANRRTVEQFILTVSVVHTTVAVLREFGRLKADLEREGLLVPDADLLIAATALCCCTRLVTGNTAHFARFPELRTENWLR